MDFNPTEFDLAQGFKNWGSVVGVIAAVAVVLGLLAALLSGSKPIRGFTSYLQDLVAISPSRILAIARLTLKEALRRKALLVFVVFAVLLMFAGWFLSSGNTRDTLQVGVHISFLLTAISWLILPAAMFLACWSIPEDIRVRSLHTVVTKPVRRIEIVLGRIVGFGGVVLSVLLVMGIAGYVWIQRQVPAEVSDQLTCRVPVYGILYFIDRSGAPAPVGINTGDVWAYRSYIEGNTPARAVWMFRGVTPESVGEQIRLESRFEAFRTVKGSEESQDKGVEGQYILVNNMREEAFASFSVGPGLRDFSNELRDGQFQNAADSLREFATTLTDGSGNVSPQDVQTFYHAANAASQVLNHLEFADLAATFLEGSEAAAAVSGPTDSTGLQNLSESCNKLADQLSERGDELLERLPRVEVPLPTFNVTEYHEGQDQYTVDRRIEYTADYESLARYLAKTVADWSKGGRLVSGGSLADGLARTLSEDTDISELNAEQLVDVLQEEIDAGTLTADGDRLAVADEQSWLVYFSQLVRAERLISQDPAGWVLTADLFDDLTFDGTLRIEVACLNDQLFIGMARPDLFIRMPDNPFYVGYAKALLNTALMMLLVIVIGVTASCIVKGPVAFFLTFSVFIVGQAFHGFMVDIVAGRVEGAGMLESTVLILQQRNPAAGMDVSETLQNIIRWIDGGVAYILQAASQVVPNFGIFSDATAYVEKGFDVPWGSSVMPAIVTFFAFLIPCVLLAAAFLKFRELEAK